MERASNNSITPAAIQLHAWLEAHNSGDQTAAYRFLENQTKLTETQNLQFEWGYRRTGGLDLRLTEEDTPTSIRAIVQDRVQENFARIALEVEHEAPWSVTGLSIESIATPPGHSVARMSEKDALAALRQHLDELVSGDQFSGAVLIRKRGNTLLAEAYGERDRDDHLPSTIDTPFNSGSMGKMFTAVCVVRLLQDGLVQLSDSLLHHVADYPNTEAASRLTLHHLLTHTGGTGDIFGPDFAARRDQLKTVQDYVNVFGERDLQFTPGRNWSYSNYGFILLGLVIERVSKQSFYDYVQEHVFDLAGMSSSTYLPQADVADCAANYTRRSPDSGWELTIGMRNYGGSPAGGCISTVGDFGRFTDALLEHRLLDAVHTALLTTGKVDARGGEYAYGFGAHESEGVRWFGHGGGAQGINGDLRIYPDSGYQVAVLANLDPPAAVRVSSYIGNRLPPS